MYYTIMITGNPGLDFVESRFVVLCPRRAQDLLHTSVRETPEWRKGMAGCGQHIGSLVREVFWRWNLKSRSWWPGHGTVRITVIYDSGRLVLASKIVPTQICKT